MSTSLWKLQPSLIAAGRLPRASTAVGFSLAELVILATAGFAAACAEAWLHISFRIPGHAILRAMLPMMFGLALVPRFAVGSTMGLFAGLSALAINCFPGGGISLAAGLSMVLVGPAIDLALGNATDNRWLYARFACAGVLANVAALAVKLIASSIGFESIKHPMPAFLFRAIPSFIFCGALAGLLAGVILFRSGHRR